MSIVDIADRGSRGCSHEKSYAIMKDDDDDDDDDDDAALDADFNDLATGMARGGK